MQMLPKICRKSESSLPFSYENTVMNTLHVRHNEHFLSLAQIDKLHRELKRILVKKHAQRAFNWPKYACINISISGLLIPWCAWHKTQNILNLPVSETLYRLWSNNCTTNCFLSSAVNFFTKPRNPVVRRLHNQMNMMRFVGRSFNW